ncbi:SDR family NAD(P)-dependent oxidoreductase [Sporomusa sp. KB1]|jgi:3-oxoacyl-[acyl-carrier protein] reductase|uniref:SDR family NAD(P)-dependent oxidoreductase n=1 Tax=Sporomusa sp. KB1 TaxID=943346 RepID=UPI0011A89B9D|nr:SDR family NAD(P)-dependent oxidoreductase [Sporomusa sp. KB1]TWH45525.1 3-oxoacyl-[acyl-carrier-protein] reductase [Sporomusa sp. KB1]
MSKCFKGKYAVITGAAGGICKDTALCLAERGAAGIMIADLNYEKALATAQEIEDATGSRCLAFATDVSKPADIAALFAFTMEKFGAVHILVNGAGVCPTTKLEDLDAEKWDWCMNINLRGAHLCCREAIRIMKEQKYGRIVNIASMSYRVGGIAASVSYGASKGGLASATKTYAKLTAQDGITINAICPGLIMTDMTRNNGYSADGIPMGRLGEPRDVSTVIAFLASDDSRYMTGCTLDVNGGMYMTM